jgi:hypothetical protein
MLLQQNLLIEKISVPWLFFLQKNSEPKRTATYNDPTANLVILWLE